jgi:hypothetical protein
MLDRYEAIISLWKDGYWRRRTLVKIPGRFGWADGIVSSLYDGCGNMADLVDFCFLQELTFTHKTGVDYIAVQRALALSRFCPYRSSAPRFSQRHRPTRLRGK